MNVWAVQFAFIAWPILVLILFRVLDSKWAATIAVVAGFLILPREGEVLLDLGPLIMPTPMPSEIMVE